MDVGEIIEGADKHRMIRAVGIRRLEPRQPRLEARLGTRVIPTGLKNLPEEQIDPDPVDVVLREVVSGRGVGLPRRPLRRGVVPLGIELATLVYSADDLRIGRHDGTNEQSEQQRKGRQRVPRSRRNPVAAQPLLACVAGGAKSAGHRCCSSYFSAEVKHWHIRTLSGLSLHRGSLLVRLGRLNHDLRLRLGNRPGLLHLELRLRLRLDEVVVGARRPRLRLDEVVGPRRPRLLEALLLEPLLLSAPVPILDGVPESIQEDPQLPEIILILIVVRPLLLIVIPLLGPVVVPLLLIAIPLLGPVVVPLLLIVVPPRPVVPLILAAVLLLPARIVRRARRTGAAGLTLLLHPALVHLRIRAIGPALVEAVV
jgi:hypothetical protein